MTYIPTLSFWLVLISSSFLSGFSSGFVGVGAGIALIVIWRISENVLGIDLGDGDLAESSRRLLAFSSILSLSQYPFSIYEMYRAKERHFRIDLIVYTFPGINILTWVGTYFATSLSQQALLIILGTSLMIIATWQFIHQSLLNRGVDDEITKQCEVNRLLTHLENQTLMDDGIYIQYDDETHHFIQGHGDNNDVHNQEEIVEKQQNMNETNDNQQHEQIGMNNQSFNAKIGYHSSKQSKQQSNHNNHNNNGNTPCFNSNTTPTHNTTTPSRQLHNTNRNQYQNENDEKNDHDDNINAIFGPNTPQIYTSLPHQSTNTPIHQRQRVNSGNNGNNNDKHGIMISTAFSSPSSQSSSHDENDEEEQLIMTKRNIQSDSYSIEMATISEDNHNNNNNNHHHHKMKHKEKLNNYIDINNDLQHNHSNIIQPSSSKLSSSQSKLQQSQSRLQFSPSKLQYSSNNLSNFNRNHSYLNSKIFTTTKIDQNDINSIHDNPNYISSSTPNQSTPHQIESTGQDLADLDPIQSPQSHNTHNPQQQLQQKPPQNLTEVFTNALHDWKSMLFGITVGCISGLIGGLWGINSPPLTVYFSYLGLTGTVIRDTCLFIYFANLPCLLAARIIFKIYKLDEWLIYLCVAPITIAGLKLGWILHDKVQNQRLILTSIQLMIFLSSIPLVKPFPIFPTITFQSITFALIFVCTFIMLGIFIFWRKRRNAIIRKRIADEYYEQLDYILHHGVSIVTGNNINMNNNDIQQSTSSQLLFVQQQQQQEQQQDEQNQNDEPNKNQSVDSNRSHNIGRVHSPTNKRPSIVMFNDVENQQQQSDNNDNNITINDPTLQPATPSSKPIYPTTPTMSTKSIHNTPNIQSTQQKQKLPILQLTTSTSTHRTKPFDSNVLTIHDIDPLTTEDLQHSISMVLTTSASKLLLLQSQTTPTAKTPTGMKLRAGYNSNNTNTNVRSIISPTTLHNRSSSSSTSTTAIPTPTTAPPFQLSPIYSENISHSDISHQLSPVASIPFSPNSIHNDTYSDGNIYNNDAISQDIILDENNNNEKLFSINNNNNEDNIKLKPLSTSPTTSTPIPISSQITPITAQTTPKSTTWKYFRANGSANSTNSSSSNDSMNNTINNNSSNQNQIQINDGGVNNDKTTKMTNILVPLFPLNQNDPFILNQSILNNQSSPPPPPQQQHTQVNDGISNNSSNRSNDSNNMNNSTSIVLETLQESPQMIPLTTAINNTSTPLTLSPLSIRNNNSNHHQQQYHQEQDRQQQLSNDIRLLSPINNTHHSNDLTNNNITTNINNNLLFISPTSSVEEEVFTYQMNQLKTPTLISYSVQQHGINNKNNTISNKNDNINNVTNNHDNDNNISNINDNPQSTFKSPFLPLPNNNNDQIKTERRSSLHLTFNQSQDQQQQQQQQHQQHIEHDNDELIILRDEIASDNTTPSISDVNLATNQQQPQQQDQLDQNEDQDVLDEFNLPLQLHQHIIPTKRKD